MRSEFRGARNVVPSRREARRKLPAKWESQLSDGHFHTPLQVGHPRSMRSWTCGGSSGNHSAHSWGVTSHNAARAWADAVRFALPPPPAPPSGTGLRPQPDRVQGQTTRDKRAHQQTAMQLSFDDGPPSKTTSSCRARANQSANDGDDARDCRSSRSLPTASRESRLRIRGRQPTGLLDRRARTRRVWHRT
jgi:hypothetical protein